MSGSNIEPNRRDVDRRGDDSTAHPCLDGDRRGLDRRHFDRLRTAEFREELPLAAWLEAMLEHEIAEAF
ncbi:MAG: hypothetical protein QOH48_2251 [Actinomycetota bacterium]|jgi:hypothetical protein|nr:hypothetical protein [Actinomycetota bacterium]